MRDGAEIESFKTHLARMDDPTVGLLGSYFDSRALACHKLFRLCGFATPAGGEPAPAWSRWAYDVPRKKQAELVRSLAAVILAEAERRSQAARAAEQARRNSITPQDGEALSDAELAAAATILAGPLDTPRARWELMVRLGGLCPGGLRSLTWRKWSRLSEASEETMAAAAEVIGAEAHRRGLVAGPVHPGPAAEEPDQPQVRPDRAGRPGHVPVSGAQRRPKSSSAQRPS